MMRRFFFLPFFLCLAMTLRAEELSLHETDDGYEVRVGDELFAGYVIDFKGTPILWPLVGPGGNRMTRDYPMAERPDGSEAKDHPHHRSLWFTHGEVNDANFWHLEGEKIVHRRFAEANCDGKTVVLVTENDWLGKDGKPLCTDRRTLRFRVLEGKNGPVRSVDFDVTVTAARDGVVFGDTKEGSFGIRVPGTMDGDAKKRNAKWGGHIVNAEGRRGDDAWARRSAWVDYSGPVEGKTQGIAILNHPSSFRYPTYWHVRTYGLFAANPFGVHDFERKKEKTGEHRMDRGESFTLHYRVLFHDGDAEAAGIAAMFENYSKQQF